MNFKIKKTIKFLLIFSLLAIKFSVFSEEKKLPKEITNKISTINKTKESWYIRKASGTKAGKILHGPFENKNQALAVWIYLEIQPKKTFCIAQNEKFITSDPDFFYNEDSDKIKKLFLENEKTFILKCYFDLEEFPEEKTILNTENMNIKTENIINSDNNNYPSFESEDFDFSEDFSSFESEDFDFSDDFSSFESDNSEFSDDFSSFESEDFDFSEDFSSFESEDFDFSEDFSSFESEDYNFEDEITQKNETKQTENTTNEFSNNLDIQNQENQNNNEINNDLEKLTDQQTINDKLKKDNESKTEAAFIQFEMPENSQTYPRYKKDYLQDYIPKKEVPLPTDEEEIQEYKILNPDEKDNKGCTLLMKAAESGNNWELNALIKSGADVNLKDNDGWTALMYAVRYQQNISIVNSLLTAGANVKEKNNYNLSALMIASTYNNNPEIISKLLSYYSVSEKEVLQSFVLLLTDNSCSEYSKIAKVEVFIKKSIPLNSFYEGKTPLMYAAEYGNSTKLIKYLIDEGASPSIRSKEGKTAFDYAMNNKALIHDDNFWSLNKK